MKRLILAFVMIAVLSLQALAFAPPTPFPVRVDVVMGGSPLTGHAVTVSILDSDNAAVYDSAAFGTNDDGRAEFDLSDLRGCSTFGKDGACYAGSSRGYAGDNVEFLVAWNNQNYRVVKSVEDLRLQIGVDPKLQIVLVADVDAPVQIIEVEVPGEDVVVEVPGDDVIVEVPGDTVIVVEEVGLEDDVFLGLSGLARDIFTLFGWGVGFVALAQYWWRKGKKKRALKMLRTGISKAIQGKYKKKK